MKKSVAKTVGLVMVITLLSRLMALLSQQIYMTRFGVNAHMDIYSYAVNFQVYTINCIGTTLITVMIPVFAGFIGTGEKKRAFRFANNVITLSSLLAGLLTVAGMVLAPYIIKLTQFESTGEHGFAVTALRIMFPVLIFYTLTYTLQGILQSQGRFLVPAIVSLSSSLVVILYTLIFGSRFGIKGLLIATLIGLSSQALIQIPSVYRTEYRFSPSFGVKDRDVVDALKLVPPILISSSAYQINMIFNMSMAANFQDTVSVVNVAQQLVLAAILSTAISMTSVMFPRLTTLAASNNIPEFKQSVLKILKTMVFLLVPMTLGLMSVSNETVNFIYGYGKFTPENVSLTAKILAFYCIGGVGLGIKEVADKAFYSLKDTVKPAIVGVIMMVVNVTFSLLLMNFIGVFAIPVAYSIAALVGSTSSLYILWRKIGSFGVMDFLKSGIKILVSSVAMVAAVLAVAFLLRGIEAPFGLAGALGAVGKNAIKLFIPVGVGAVIFFICAWFLKVEEAVEALGKVKGKLLRKA